MSELKMDTVTKQQEQLQLKLERIQNRIEKLQKNKKELEEALKQQKKGKKILVSTMVVATIICEMLTIKKLQILKIMKI